MRRQKRDRFQRAYSRGYHAAISGHPKDMCPYHELAIRELWLSGWRAGRTDIKTGMFSG